MAWVRIHDAALTHPKISVLGDKAFRLWVWGLSYCQQHLTDGLVVAAEIPSRLREARNHLLTVTLWERHQNGKDYQIHDYLDWNDPKSTVIEKRNLARVRMALVRDPIMRNALRERDRDMCRYCGLRVNWSDRKSRHGATYDHVTPGAGETYENLVIACRGCNSKKNRRTPEQAGMRLLPEPDESRYETRNINTKINMIHSGVDLSTSSTLLEKEEPQIDAKRDPFTDRAITERAGRFIDKYQQLYTQHRHGARYMVRPARDYQAAVTLCATWTDDVRLEKLAVIFLTTDHSFAESGSRTLPQFAALASWADGKLAEFETKKARLG